MKGADMITPVRTMTINQIVERKDELLMSDDDIKELAKNERAKAIDEFAEEVRKAYTSMKSVSDVERSTANTIVLGIAEKLKGGAT
jgi:hypothetical protein